MICPLYKLDRHSIYIFAYKVSVWNYIMVDFGVVFKIRIFSSVKYRDLEMIKVSTYQIDSVIQYVFYTNSIKSSVEKEYVHSF